MWKESFFDFIVEDPALLFQCSYCGEDYNDRYHSAICERCYYDDVKWCALDSTVDNMDEHYGGEVLAEGIAGVAPNFIRDFIGTFMKIYDERYARVPVPPFQFAGTIRGNYDLLIQEGERERWKIPLTLGILHYAFFEPRGIALSSYIEVWLDLLPPSLIYHNDGFIASVKTAAEIPFAIAASRFNIEYLVALIHSVIYTEGVADCLVPKISTTVGLVEAIEAIEQNMVVLSEINELDETGVVMQDRERSCADPLFWEPLLRSVADGVFDSSYGSYLDVVIPYNHDDVGMWNASIATEYGDYSIYVRKECCNASPGYGPETLSMHVECIGTCGVYSPREAGYKRDSSIAASGRYWRRVTSTVLYGNRCRPVMMHPKWSVMSVMDTSDSEWSLVVMDGTSCKATGYGEYVFPNARWVSEGDYSVCSERCEHQMCRLSGLFSWKKKSYAYIDSDKGEYLYFLSAKELEKIAMRRKRRLSVPWQFERYPPKFIPPDELSIDDSSSDEVAPLSDDDQSWIVVAYGDDYGFVAIVDGVG